MSSLTPIKIRGKKQKSSGLKADVPLNPRSKGKRPISSLPNLPSPVKVPRGLRVNPAMTVVRHGALLEQLPTELLEVIFFYCLNLNLPQASPVIGHKLASHHVKSKLTLQVLSSASRTNQLGASAAAFSTRCEQADAQSTLLRLRWMTLPFLKRIIPDYIVSILIRELGARHMRWMGDGPVVSRDCEPLIRKYLEDNDYRLDEARPGRIPAYSEIIWREAALDPTNTAFRPDKADLMPGVPDNPTYNHIRLGLGLRDGQILLLQRDYSESFDVWSILRGVEGCKIPEKLLHGPWTDDKCEFLEMVIRGNASIDWVGTTSGEVANEGLLQALKEGNARATKALLARIGSSLFDWWATKDSAHDQPLSKDLSDSFDRRGPPVRKGVGILPQTEHLRTAVIEGGCEPSVVEALLDPVDSSIDVDDDIIRQWTFKQCALGNPRAKWLHEKLYMFDYTDRPPGK